MAKKNSSKLLLSKLSAAEFWALAVFFALPLALTALTALFSGGVPKLLPTRLQTYLSKATSQASADLSVAPKTQYSSCEAHQYTSEIVSLDPLVIYINNFTSIQEAEELIKLGEDDFEDSFISRSTGLHKVSGRTSQSAPLEPTYPLVSCILTRARTFMGAMLQPDESFSIPQLVRYAPKQRYDLHTDFWPQHQVVNDGSGRRFNRVASFFVFLRDNCTEGETYFPAVDVLDRDAERGGGIEKGFGGKVARGEKDGATKGVKFKPIAGNAIFWVNMDNEGRGDRRLVHAGLPVGEGEKIGMNLWPRKFYSE
ncbi:hypothetical protein K505DRAFT_380848 [Melanomma pulvis-pyrius CBS 109.77]|uniref:Fe2OG dioxygenase domain-containing protein n=1 Tax=Melanomma pulvis-pyrius CBS 109.77 TaxID=1314802 RepID=A0A6A6WNL8_9PLEO|nr:hypothetical protein K505DRAFT_380848 [Melanomma pulvis-pyrius CBS 109.77]